MMEVIDTKSTVGLRGLASIHIMLFHYLGHMTFGDVDINGSLELSTFFLLSGFCLTLKYGEQGVQNYKKYILLRMSK